MRLTKTLLIAALLGIAALIVFKVVVPKEQQRERSEFLLRGLGEKQIGEIQVQSTAGYYSLVNTASDPSAKFDPLGEEEGITRERLSVWKLGGVEYSDLDEGSLNSFISALVRAKPDTTIPPDDIEADKSTYGLDKPELEITVTAGDQAYRLRFGKRNEYLSQRYVEVEGENALYLMTENLFNAAARTPLDMRNRSPIAVLEGELSGIIISSPANVIELSVGDDRDWRMVRPAPFDASDERVSQLIRAIRGLRVSEFIEGGAEQLESFGLSQPQAELTLNFKDEKRPPITVRLSHADSGDGEATFVWQEDRKSVLRIDTPGTIGQFALVVDDLRERKVFQFPVDLVAAVSYREAQEPPMELQKGVEGWQVDGAEGDAPFIREALSRLSALQADGFPSEQRDYGFNAPTVEVVLQIESQGESKEQRRLVVGSIANMTDQGKVYYAATDDLKEPFLLKESSFRAVLPRKEALLKLPDDDEAQQLGEGEGDGETAAFGELPGHEGHDH